MVKDKVLVCASGGEFGVRGHIDAFDLQSGKRAWRRDTIPRPEEPGGATWGNAQAWQRGSGTTWITGTHDP